MGMLGGVFTGKIMLFILAFVGVVVLIFAGFFILRWLRGGFGRFTKPSARYQKCVAITANNKLAFYNLEVVGNCVVDWDKRQWHILDPDALIPYLPTGEPYLPIDERDAIPLYPLKPDEFRTKKVLELKTNLKSIAEEANRDARMKAQLMQYRADQIAQRNFMLLAAFGILALVVLIAIIMKFVHH